jgi:hypothetical protein
MFRNSSSSFILNLPNRMSRTDFDDTLLRFLLPFGLGMWHPLHYFSFPIFFHRKNMIPMKTTIEITPMEINDHIT